MYSSCSRVEVCFKREERNVFISSFIYSVKGLGPLLHAAHRAMHFKCNAVQWRYNNENTKQKALPSWNSYASNYCLWEKG